MASRQDTEPEDTEFAGDLRAFFEEQREQRQPSQTLLQRLHKIPEEKSQGWFWQLWWTPVPLAALSLVAVFLWKPVVTPLPIFRPKGSSWQILFARQDRGTPKGMLAQELKSGSKLNPGDLVQFVFEVPPQTHAMIVGLNQEGKVYPMVTQHDGRSLLLRKRKGILPQQRGSASAFKLDQYIGLERFFIATSRRPFSYNALKRAIRAQWKRTPNVIKCHRVRGPWHITSTMFLKIPKKAR